MPHFFVPPSHIHEGRFYLLPDESAHVARVLRKKSGDEVGLFDGVNRAYRGVLETVSPEKVEGRILAEGPVVSAPYRLRLFQGMPKGDKFEFVLEKAAELGVAEIVPLITRRVVAKIPEERWAAKGARWNKIVRAASAQCGRTDVPVVAAPIPWTGALRGMLLGETSWIAWEGERGKTLKEVVHSSGFPRGSKTVNVMIGPEGGFDPREVDQAVAAGVIPVTLGPRILRTETAGLFVASVLLHEWGQG